MDRVGAAPELLGDQRPFAQRPALAAVLGVVQAAVEARLDRLPPDPLDRLLRKLPVVALRLLLERDQHLVGESPGALLELPGGLVEGGDGHRRAKYHVIDYKVNKRDFGGFARERSRP